MIQNFSIIETNNGLVMDKKIITQKIVETLRDDLNYNLALDSNVSETTLNEVLDKLFKEPDDVKLNMCILHLLSVLEEKASKVLCIYVLKNPSRGRLTKFVAQRIHCINQYRLTHSGNRTKNIPFTRGTIKASTPNYISVLRNAMDDEAKNLEEGWYKSCLCEFSQYTKEEDSYDKPEFIVLNENEELVGYLALTMADRDDDFWEKYCDVIYGAAWNLEYYTLPSFRKKRYMKDALPAFLRAVSEDAIQYQDNRAFDYVPEMHLYAFSLVYAKINKENFASIKTIEALGLFDLLKDKEGNPISDENNSLIYITKV